MKILFWLFVFFVACVFGSVYSLSPLANKQDITPSIESKLITVHEPQLGIDLLNYLDTTNSVEVYSRINSEELKVLRLLLCYQVDKSAVRLNQVLYAYSGGYTYDTLDSKLTAIQSHITFLKLKAYFHERSRQNPNTFYNICGTKL